jgi:pectate lyase-like protein
MNNLLSRLLRISFVRVSAVFAALLLFTSAHAHADCINVRTAGATGNGTTDDTAAIQKAIRTAIVNHRGGTVCIPSGSYLVTSTLIVDDVQGIKLIGDGGASRLIWGGDDASPLLLLSSVQDAEVSGFQIIALASKPLAVGIQCITRAGATLTSKSNTFANLRIDGVTRGVAKGFRIGGAPGIDANNDFHVFRNCIVANYSAIAYSLEDTQIYGVEFINSMFLGNASGQIGLATDQHYGKGGTFTWSGGGGGNNQIADFSLGDPNSGGIAIKNAVFEKSARFVRTGGPSGASFLLKIDGVRWAGDALADDGIAIDFRFPGPLVITDSRIGEYPDKALKISWRPGGTTPGVFIFEGNVVRRASKTPLFLYQQPTRLADNVLLN